MSLTVPRLAFVSKTQADADLGSPEQQGEGPEVWSLVVQEGELMPTDEHAHLLDLAPTFLGSLLTEHADVSKSLVPHPFLGENRQLVTYTQVSLRSGGGESIAPHDNLVALVRSSGASKYDPVEPLEYPVAHGGGTIQRFGPATTYAPSYPFAFEGMYFGMLHMMEGEADKPQENHRLSILKGNGGGQFATDDGGSPPNKFEIDVATMPKDLAVEDLNGDGRDDIAVLSLYEGVVQLLCSRSDGALPDPDIRTFVYDPENPNAPLDEPFGVAVGDLDGDGNPAVAGDEKDEIVTANSGTDSISILWNNGSGSTTLQILDLGAGDKPIAVLIADIDGDGTPEAPKNDLLVVRKGTNGFTVALSGGNALSQTSLPAKLTNIQSTSRSRPVAVALGYIDDDNLLDVVLAQNGIPGDTDPPESLGVAVHYQDGGVGSTSFTGAFVFPIGVPGPGYPLNRVHKSGAGHGGLRTVSLSAWRSAASASRIRISPGCASAAIPPTARAGLCWRGSSANESALSIVAGGNVR